MHRLHGKVSLMKVCKVVFETILDAVLPVYKEIKEMHVHNISVLMICPVCNEIITLRSVVSLLLICSINRSFVEHV